MSDYVNVAGRLFPKKLYDRLIAVFAEGFSHSSLSIEDYIMQIKKYNFQVNDIYKNYEINKDRFMSLSKKDRDFAIGYLKYMVMFMSVRRGLIECNLDDKVDINNKFNSLFPSLGANLPYLVCLNEQGKFDPNLSYPKLVEVMELLIDKNNLEREVTLMKQDYIDAFNYAMSVNHIGIKEIKEINAIVNEHSSNRAERGSFKKVNNQVNGASFETTDKSLVPTKIAELIYNYDNNWGNGLPNVDFLNGNPEEKQDILLELFKREARFHIEFIRIHPFEDGNGRTGRIILNAHLLQNGLTPVLITGEIAKDYKKYINNYDVDGFASELLNWSSQELTRWISELRVYNHIDPSQVEFDANLSSKRAKKK